jgi:two-component sensor histidine kinase
VLSLKFLSEFFLSAAFAIVAITLIGAVYPQEDLHPRFKSALVLFIAGLVLLSLGLIAPHFYPGISGSLLALTLKAVPTALIFIASLIIWPFVRQAAQHKRLLGSFSETQLLRLERDDLAAAKTKLEKEIVRGAYQLERANRQLRLALLRSPISIFRQNTDLEYTWVFNAPEGTDEDDFIGNTDQDIYASETALTVTEIKRAAMETHEEQSTEVRVQSPSGNYWYMLRTQPDYDEHGHIIGVLSCAVNITDQKRHQNRQELLMREVTHRSKNLLAVLQSIVRQTALRTRDIETFMVQLNARLQSIAKSHDLLVNDDWSGTSMRKLFESQLTVLSDIGTERVRLNGPNLLLTSVAVQNLGLAFHELATNATKYGALSTPRGYIEIDWEISTGERVNGSGEADLLCLIWQEHGGPSVVLSEDSGFGRMLLERVVGKALGGEVKLDFASDGLVCTMRLPVSRVITDHGVGEQVNESAVHAQQQ